MIRSTIEPGNFFGVHAVSDGRAAGYASLMRMGRNFPPVVVVKYDETYMPLDGHHRLTAAKINNTFMSAWVIDGEWFEEACQRRRDAGKQQPDMALIRLADRLERRLEQKQ